MPTLTLALLALLLLVLPAAYRRQSNDTPQAPPIVLPPYLKKNAQQQEDTHKAHATRHVPAAPHAVEPPPATPEVPPSAATHVHHARPHARRHAHPRTTAGRHAHSRSAAAEGALIAQSTPAAASGEPAPPIVLPPSMQIGHRNAAEPVETAAQQRAAAKAQRDADLKAQQQAALEAKQAAAEKARQEAEAKAQHRATAQAQRDADLKAQQQAALEAKQVAAEKTRQEAEAKAQQRAAAQAQREADLKAQQQTAMEAKQAAAEKARQEADAKAQLKAQREVDLKAQQQAALEAKQAAAEKARQEAAAKAQQQAAAKVQREADLKAQQQAALEAKQAAAEKARQEAEAKAQQQAAAKAQREADLKAQQQAALEAKQAAADKTRQEAEAKAQQQATARAQREADLKAQQQAALQAKQDAAEKARQQAEQEAQRRAAEQAQHDADLKAQQAAALQAKQDADLRAQQQAREEADLKAQQKAAKKGRKPAPSSTTPADVADIAPTAAEPSVASPSVSTSTAAITAVPAPPPAPSPIATAAPGATTAPAAASPATPPPPSAANDMMAKLNTPLPPTAVPDAPSTLNVLGNAPATAPAATGPVSIGNTLHAKPRVVPESEKAILRPATSVNMGSDPGRPGTAPTATAIMLPSSRPNTDALAAAAAAPRRGVGSNSRPAEAPAPALLSPAAFPGLHFSFVGADLYTAPELINVTGIHPGQTVDSDALTRANQRFIDSGLFADASASSEAKDGVEALTFTLRPVPESQLARPSFANFVWLTPAEIDAALNRIPLYHGFLPASGTGTLVDAVQATLAGLLQEQGTRASVGRSLVPPSLRHPYVSVVFRVTDPEVRLATTNISGAPGSLVQAEIAAQRLAVASHYNQGTSGDSTEDILLTPVRNAGYLEAHLVDVSLQRHILSREVVVGLTARIDAGRQYRVGRLNWPGSAVYSVSDFQRQSPMHTGDLTSGPLLELTQRTILAAYRSQGYLDAQLDTTMSLDPTNGIANYTFVANPGEPYRVRAIKVDGLSPTAKAQFDQAFTLKPGDLLNDNYLQTFLLLNPSEKELAQYTYSYQLSSMADTHQADVAIQFKPR